MLGGKDISLLLKPLERLPHGRATDAEALGNLGLDDARAGLELSLDDELSKPAVDLIGAGAVRDLSHSRHPTVNITAAGTRSRYSPPHRWRRGLPRLAPRCIVRKWRRTGKHPQRDD